MIIFPSLRAGAVLAATTFLLALTAQADEPPVRKVTVTGTATIKVVPDQMLWTVQVAIDDTTVARAKTRHDASLGEALIYLKGLGASLTDLQTGGMVIQKNNYAPADSPAARHPFSCSTQVTFTLDDFTKYGPICDELAKLDGVQLQSIDYAYSKQSDVRRDALKQALVNARQKADDLAGTADCTLGNPLEIVEGSGDGPRPLMMNALARSADAMGTPAAVAGQIEINGVVSATYELVPK